MAKGERHFRVSILQHERYRVCEHVVVFLVRGVATEGPAGFVHGGSMASILDEAMGAAVWLIGFTAVAARISVDYRNMLPLGTVTSVEANVISVNGRKIVSAGKISDEAGTVYAESEGLYINLPSERFGKMVHYRDEVKESLSGTDNKEQ